MPLLGDGGGGFGSPTELPGGSASTYALEVADVNGDGGIDLEELQKVLLAKDRYTEDAVASIYKSLDADGNGEIDFDEFVTVMSRKVNTSYTPTQVKAAFKVFEAPNSGLQVGPCPLSPADSASSPHRFRYS